MVRMNEDNTKYPSERTEDDKKPYNDFLQRFRTMVELGNWSEDLEKSGTSRVYRLTVQYLKPSTYRLILSCDDDQDKQYFSRTADVYDNSQNLEDIAHALVRKATIIF